MTGPFGPHLIAVENLETAVPPGFRLMGLDLGAKTIGVALSDVGLRIATPMRTIQRTRFKADAAVLQAIAAKEKVGALAVGLPLNMDGSAGPRVQSVQSFLRGLAPLLPLPVILWDERLSTVAATRTLLEADLSRAKRAAVIDAAASAYILQGALDRLRHLRTFQNSSSSSSS